MRTVFITGASSGIGAACAEVLASEKKYRLLLCARRLSKLTELQKRIQAQNPDCEVFCFELDVRDQSDIIQKLKNLPNDWKDIDILINNAGLSQGLDLIQNGDPDDWDRMIDTNVKGLLYVTKHTIPLMQESTHPHIINLGSIAGKEVYPSGNVYCATKHAVDALTKAMRIDLLEKGIKVTSIDPGMVETEFSEVRFKGDKERAKNVYNGLTPLSGKDIADIISFVLSRPAHVNINDLLVMPTAQASGTIVKRDTL
ncbi:SDR family NAD(P)-dependent oxidoreductase [Sphingobacterium psychroaquaticum]|uniref:NADP-dependent 3-hydroxy acid dehydrogenase YdfG n=1 Tax=Sphingobacterium psychroaquaticum TaxID=561061 RepID=A0A1X7JJX6_9SPHI|nr:SDR family NAD(P)-dependent oxidoreductase [Sphingobacterium psychroaquaticum]SMG28061.1 NADP-dependent 3-hydroxy acid dehydrogenase YdfG [Sphingobacterium psychroaquaticum]